MKILTTDIHHCHHDHARLIHSIHSDTIYLYLCLGKSKRYQKTGQSQTQHLSQTEAFSCGIQKKCHSHDWRSLKQANAAMAEADWDPEQIQLLQSGQPHVTGRTAWESGWRYGGFF